MFGRDRLAASVFVPVLPPLIDVAGSKDGCHSAQSIVDEGGKVAGVCGLPVLQGAVDLVRQGTVWVSDHGAKRLFAYRLEDGQLRRNRDEEFTELSRASNNSPRGIWSDADVMYAADESDGRVYTYNMPDAIDAPLGSLTLSGIDIGEFAGDATEYVAAVAGDVTETTVEVASMQRRTTVVIEPPGADGNDANGHQVSLAGLDAITVTVTSADGNRTKTYRVQVGEAPAEEAETAVEFEAGWNTFAWPGAEGIPIADAFGDSDLRNTVVAAYAWDEESSSWLAFFPALHDVPGLNTLTTLAQGATYWIATTEPVTWTLTTGGDATAAAIEVP